MEKRYDTRRKRCDEKRKRVELARHRKGPATAGAERRSGDREMQEARGGPLPRHGAGCRLQSNRLRGASKGTCQEPRDSCGPIGLKLSRLLTYLFT